jgi:DNA ligase D-like protein (predicted 3'-phosphoesterase)
MGLEEYRKKRDFSRTKEPEVGSSFCREIEKKYRKKIRKTGRPLYMVHDHRSRSHHHDLRLEMDGVLKSWAIPKLIDPGNLYKRKLAVQTEDHPLAYGYWEGEIPEGNYGAGKVSIWDTGSFKIIDYKKEKKIVFSVRGKKLKGTFVLIHFRPGGNSWLFFRKKGG